MTTEAERFLAWALPQRGLRWRGFRRNRRQVYRRLRERITALGLADHEAYRTYLAAHSEEWSELDALCRVTISRFARDLPMWTALVADVLPRLAARVPVTRAWSAGCGAGEEPYTLAIAWAQLAPIPSLEVLATDLDDAQLARAARATYPTGALRELPAPWRAAAFDERDEEAQLRDGFRSSVRFERRDIRELPRGPFDLVMCRNLAYSYFDESAQAAFTVAVRATMTPGSVLVVGGDEALPDDRDFALHALGIYVAR